MTQEHNTQAIKLTLSHYWQQMKRHWATTLLALLLPGIGNILVFYVPTLIIAQILTRFSGGEFAVSDLLPYVAWFTAIWLTGELLWRACLFFLARAEARAIGNLYNNALNFLLEKDIAFFNDNFAGALTKKVTGYAKNYEGFMDTLVFNVFSNLLPLIFISVVLWRFSPWLAIVLLSLLLLAIVFMRPLMKRRQKLVAVRETANNVLTGHVADSISNIAAVRTFSHEKHEAIIHADNVRDFISKVKRSWDYQNTRIDMVTAPMYVLINATGLMTAIIVSQHTDLNLETVFVTFSFYATFTRIMWEFNRIYRNLESNVTDAAQFTELLLEPPTITDPVKPEPFAIHTADVRFENVSFRYNDSTGQHLFKNLNLAIKPGEKVGLVGQSGGGKTTITKLLLRLMDINDGEILISGQNIAKIKQAELREHIAYVPQEPLLFHRSIADNIRYGKLNASRNEVEKVAKLAHAHEFIKDLSKGYETLVGERGVKLSGGQRQRITIARAMIKDAPILVLDEATSALDSESEVLIQDALWQLMKGRTAIVIAHRLSTVQKMDRIIVLEKGAIIEQGTHHELLAKKGTYAKLWNHQSGGFLEE